MKFYCFAKKGTQKCTNKINMRMRLLGSMRYKNKNFSLFGRSIGPHASRLDKVFNNIPNYNHKFVLNQVNNY